MPGFQSNRRKQKSAEDWRIYDGSRGNMQRAGTTSATVFTSGELEVDAAWGGQQLNPCFTAICDAPLMLPEQGDGTPRAYIRQVGVSLNMGLSSRLLTISLSLLLILSGAALANTCNDFASYACSKSTPDIVRINGLNSGQSIGIMLNSNTSLPMRMHSKALPVGQSFPLGRD